MKTATFRVSGERNDDSFRIVIEGDLSIKNANPFFRQLRAAKIVGGKVNLVLQNVEKLDITTIQTIRIFRQMVMNGGKSISIHPDLNEDSERLLKNSGFNSSL